MHPAAHAGAGGLATRHARRIWILAVWPLVLALPASAAVAIVVDIWPVVQRVDQFNGEVGCRGTLGPVAPTLSAIMRPLNDCLHAAERVAWRDRAVGSTAHATLEAAEPLPCSLYGASVWFRLEEADGPVDVDSFGSAFDSVLAVYRAPPTPPTRMPELELVACNNDLGPNQLQAGLRFWARSGWHYYIQLGGIQNFDPLRFSKPWETGPRYVYQDEGPYVLNIRGGCPPLAPDLDCFDEALVLPRPSTFQGTNVGATRDAAEPACASMDATLWFAVDGEDELVVIDTFGSEFDTVLAVHTGSSLSDLSEVACNDDAGQGAQSEVAFNALGGTRYWIQLGGAGGETGAFRLNVQ